jgi:cytochrome c oxidase subunit 2
MVLTIGSFVIDRQLAMAEDGASLHIKVTANQWWWKVEYDDPVAGRRFVTANELHLPVDRAARIDLEAGDVIHSFWVPNLGGKQDLIPGRTNHLTLTPRRVGVFRGQCAEFCGLQHANMALDVTVQSPAAFAAWAEHQRQPARAPSDPNLVHGRDVFVGAACASCHQIGGQAAMGQVGPGPDPPGQPPQPGRRRAPLQPRRPGRLDRRSAEPQARQPHALCRDQPDELNALVDYLDSLK